MTTDDSGAPFCGSEARAQGRMRVGRLILGASIALAALLIGSRFAALDLRAVATGRAAESVPASSAVFLGSAACAGCHETQAKAWRDSHHRLAMQEARAGAVLGDFNDATLAHHGVETTFFKRGEKFMVRADGPDGKPAEFEIRYTFGVFPLQQYLVDFPDGRLQAFGVAWDARPKSEGGRRWFRLHPDERVDHTDPLHWTSRYQSWNLQCAPCHSTNVRKGYDAAADAYRTTFSEIGVGCEACHGPGARHVAWARSPGGAAAPKGADNGAPAPNGADNGAQAPEGADNGLTVHPQSGWRDAWRFPDAKASVARRDKPAAQAATAVCAPCHARRSLLAEGASPGAPLEDAYRLALVAAPNYHADGQQNEEVFVWGSFRQSKMYQMGVVCADCHEPHSAGLHAEGNALCGRCHNGEIFDSPAHHRHPAGSAGAECANCHMPAKNYMVVDARRDHFIRAPRPDISAIVGSPDACTGCHAGRSQQWAAETMDGWYGMSWRNRPQDALTLHDGATQGAKALPNLLALAENAAKPAITRASAAALAEPLIRMDPSRSVAALLSDPDPLVRIAGPGLSGGLPAERRASADWPALDDPVRGVRTEAARALADIAPEQLPPERRPAWESALRDYVASLELNADWPASNVALGAIHASRGRSEEARAAYERALKLDPRFAAAYANLADLDRSQGRDDEAESVLRRGLAAAPKAADLHHALGLARVRKGERKAALGEFEEGARLAPDNARYAYVYGVALNSLGRREAALATLAAAQARHPGDVDILVALATMNRDAGDVARALVYARKLAELLPGDADARALIGELERALR